MRQKINCARRCTKQLKNIFKKLSTSFFYRACTITYVYHIHVRTIQYMYNLVELKNDTLKDILKLHFQQIASILLYFKLSVVVRLW